MKDPSSNHVDTAIEAVRAASRVCRAVQAQLVTEQTLQKKDRSPVTVADFASQAIVCALLAEHTADIPVVAEEDSEQLRQEDRKPLLNAVVQQVSAGLGRAVEASEALAWIDRGGAEAGGQRFWTLDPIDGTKGFVRKEQYAVALALIEAGQIVLGVLGCPNLPANGGTGSLLVARLGGGTRQVPVERGGFQDGVQVRVSDVPDPAEACFCESVESGHSDQGGSAKVAARLRITAEPVRMDSQAKYAAVARGDAAIYMRLPTRKNYREKIWDHAAGTIVVEEAGGRVSDIEGRALQYTHGRQLEENRGILATNGRLHEAVLEAIRAENITAPD